jgi:hypothetical protein
MELLEEAGVKVQDYSRASHPSEMQALVKDGYGFALVREGTILDDALTTRPITGVDWTVDSAVIYHQQRYPKSIPILVQQFKRKLKKDGEKIGTAPCHRSSTATKESPMQLELLG